jgi:hypothetical protein
MKPVKVESREGVEQAAPVEQPEKRPVPVDLGPHGILINGKPVINVMIVGYRKIKGT